MKNDAKNNVRDWTEEDEGKYREMLAKPAKRPTEQEQFELGAVSPYPPLGAGNVSKKKEILTKSENMIKETTTNPDSYRQEYETPFFGNNDNFAQAITEAGIKAAKATHEFNMKEIKARLIADLCVKIVETSEYYEPESVAQEAREIAENALKEI